MTDQPDALLPVTHDQARTSLKRFLNHFFNREGERPRACIPAQPKSDDDLILSRYIEEQAAKERPTPPSTIIPVRDAEPMTSEPKAKADSEAEQGVQLSRPEPTPPSALELARPDFTAVLATVTHGYGVWATKPHNARWIKLIEGTPIPNDLSVCIAEEVARALLAGRPQESAGAKWALTVWRDGSWKVWQPLDGLYAEAEGDWLLTVQSSEIEAGVARLSAEGGERE